MKNYFIFLFFIATTITFSQENKSSDDLFIEARNIAFEEKNYPKAIELMQQAVNQSPDYVDILVFLGRLYTWSDNTMAARELFDITYAKEIDNEDFYIAFGSLEYWNDNYEKALEVVNKGLFFHPTSEDLLLLKAKIYTSSKQFPEASDVIQSILTINPKNTEARALYERIKEESAKNAISVSYNYTHFDKQFSNDWHTVSIGYKRVTPIGSVILKGNFANKFSENGTQVELEAYPRISNTFYMYVAAGYSGDVGLFPKYRTGASLYANLPKSFEAEVGYRQLYFSNSILMYTASVGKYYRNYWFNLKTYLTPGDTNISQSYTATVRYYTKGANDYWSLQVGTGISPEESLNTLLEYETYKLKTFKVGGSYNFSYKKVNFFSISATYFNQEYLPETKGNQFDISIGYSKNF